MDFTPSNAAVLVKRVARDFAQRVIAPRASEIDATERFPRDIMRGLAAIGLTAVDVPKALGGAAAGTVAYALAMQEIARACASTAVMTGVTNMVGETIAHFGSEAQKRSHCPKLASGEYALGSFALSEPDAGSDPAAMRTVATRDGADWVIVGSKQWITGASFAGVLVVWARTSPAERGSHGISCFLVEKGTRGMIIGRPEDKMGIRGANTAAIELDDCRVPGDALLGVENDGFKIAMAALDGGRIGIAAQAIGVARAALSESLAYAKKRQSFGVSVAEHQAIRCKLADMRVRIDTAHLLLMRAAWSKERRRPFSREASMAKLVASEMAVDVCGDAVQIHGGCGYVRELPVERHLRDARVTTIYEGTSEIQRIVIARSVLSGTSSPTRACP